MLLISWGLNHQEILFHSRRQSSLGQQNHLRQKRLPSLSSSNVAKFRIFDLLFWIFSVATSSPIPICSCKLRACTIKVISVASFSSKLDTGSSHPRSAVATHYKPSASHCLLLTSDLLFFYIIKSNWKYSNKSYPLEAKLHESNTLNHSLLLHICIIGGWFSSFGWFMAQNNPYLSYPMLRLSPSLHALSGTSCFGSRPFSDWFLLISRRSPQLVGGNSVSTLHDLKQNQE